MKDELIIACHCRKGLLALRKLFNLGAVGQGTFAQKIFRGMLHIKDLNNILQSTTAIHPFIHHSIRTYILYNIHTVIARKQWVRTTTLYSNNQKTLEQEDDFQTQVMILNNELNKRLSNFAVITDPFHIISGLINYYLLFAL